MGKDTRRQFDWSGNIEHLEEKIAMSADPLGGLLGGQIQHHAIVDEMPPLSHHNNLPPIEHHLADELPPLNHHLQREADFWIDPDNLEIIDSELERIEQSLANAHDQSGMTNVTNNYGFDGTGQTVAIIDSGIAYDHFALGGGFGSNYRVVGGWDFTGENDADPYDDGAAGSHGTHVAGIVGASGGTHEGVAPGVDLVGLRVFDDGGNGYFSWVENALQWVHDNKDSFENPITAVNLSLGVATWNSDSIPNWANLENEFSLLEQAGIFISVSAGNSFTDFNLPGLSYPAASPHVIPVASVDDSGLLSYYSQRNSRVIAAPGRGIYSTVPDYKGNNNGITDDYASFSGTSMAAPYVAGASVIIREAMEFVGYTNITQETIYNHMISTADSFYDSATDAYYNRLNMDAAIDALMPTDEFGSTLGSAFDLGTLSGDQSTDGVIGTLNDIDYFKFTASTTGSVSFTVSNLTHDLTADWTSDTSGVWSGANNETFTIDVVAGQEYTVGFRSGDGLGYYDIDITSEASENFTFTDWGAHSFTEISNISNTGESWYRVVANNAGYFTAQAFFQATAGQVNLDIYNSNLELIAAGNPSNGVTRVDASGTVGTEYYLKITGDNSDIDFRLTNLVSVSGTTATILGTSSNDTYAFTAGIGNHYVGVNGATYGFAASSFDTINIDGGDGEDNIVITGTSGNETLTVRVGEATITGAGFTAQAINFENTWGKTGGGDDTAYLHGSVSNDVFIGTTNYSYLVGNPFYTHVRDFGEVYAVASDGFDQAFLYDSVGNDTFIGTTNYGYLAGDGFYNHASSFDRVYAVALSGGNDVANLYDSVGNDTFYGRSGYAYLRGDSSYNYASRFETVNANAVQGGYDEAYLYDSDGNDTFIGRENESSLSGNNFHNQANSFNRVYGIANAGGTDEAFLYDGSGDETFYGRENFSYLFGANFYNYVSSFDQVSAYATGGGNDLAYLYDSAGDDTFYAMGDLAYMTGENFYNYASSFDNVTAISSAGGNDTAYLYDTVGDDRFYGRATFSYLRGDGYYNYAAGFDAVFAEASSGGFDRAYIDQYSSNNLSVSGSGTGATISTGQTTGFDQVRTTNDDGVTTYNDTSVLDYIFSEI